MDRSTSRPSTSRGRPLRLQALRVILEHHPEPVAIRLSKSMLANFKASDRYLGAAHLEFERHPNGRLIPLFDGKLPLLCDETVGSSLVIMGISPCQDEVIGPFADLPPLHG